MTIFYRLFLVSISIGLGNFAASIGIGMGGVNAATRLRIAIVFGLFEGGMPVVGLLIGAGSSWTGRPFWQLHRGRIARSDGLL